MKRLRCLLGFHRWQPLKIGGSSAYEKCRDCGKISKIPEPPFPDAGA